MQREWAERCKGGDSGDTRGSGGELIILAWGHGCEQAGWMNIYMEVMSLRAWSSSSLMALYFSFWAYNSSMTRKWKAEVQGHGEWSRDGRWMRVAGTPSRHSSKKRAMHEGSDAAAGGQCRRRAFCFVLFLIKLKQKQKEQNPLENKTRNSIWKS